MSILEKMSYKDRRGNWRWKEVRFDVLFVLGWIAVLGGIYYYASR